ncbi:uncharacterized protein LOC130991872 [Salvia miltiorrhiza]|uniref:uncharacterized protein LOC130991872 n=1 Tax=Salvia miltiorrhiza TaxID=226208 RepID=UPI0025AD86ED|nr:uncharacterized protein LOC130991872 [Salvia miltiorrhiza]
MVNSAIESHQALCLKKFSMSFYVNESGKSAVAKWLEFVWSTQVECLILSFRCSRPRSMVVLKELLGEMRPMNYLKKLFLGTMRVSGEDISLFLRNCPLLMELDIRSVLTSDVHVCGATLELKKLRIRCRTETSIKISAPNLISVMVDANRRKLFLENVPKLVSAVFRIQSPKYRAKHLASAASCIISQLQTLTLNLFYPEFLANGFPHQMPNLKELTLIDKGVYEHGCLLPVKALISASPRLQKFTFTFLDKFEDATSHERFRCPHQHLKDLKFQGFHARHIIQLLTYISDNCDEFHKINTCSPLMGKAEVQVHRHHLKQLQAQLSQHIQLNFLNFT